MPKWSPLSEARDHIKKLESSAKKCEKETALWAKAAGKKIEAAFYEQEIDEEKKEELDGEINKHIDLFRNKCMCLYTGGKVQDMTAIERIIRK